MFTGRSWDRGTWFHGTVVLLVAVAMFASITMTVSLAISPAGAQADQPIAYDDPVTDRPVLRLTSDGADGCVNYMGNLSGEAISWSPDSSQVVYAKSCVDDSARTGVHIFDLATQTETCVASTGRHWAYPIFDHDGGRIHFVDGSEGARNEQDAKPFVVRTVDVPGSPDGGSICPDSATTLIDVRAATDSRVDDVMVLTKNAAVRADDELLAVHVRWGSTWRTVVFEPDGTTLPGWGFDDQTNPRHDDNSDGDASIWSPTDPYRIFTNRGTDVGDPTVQRGVWTIESPTLLYAPFGYDPACSGDYRPSTGVAHSDWAYHAGSDTQIFMSSDRCVWLIDGAGTVSLGPWQLFGYLHLNIDPTSLGGALGEVRFVADEYFDGYDAEPFIYLASLEDLGAGDANGLGDWSDIRRERKLVGHRNRLDDGSSTALKAYEPHPQFSPDGRFVLWQSSSLNQVLGYTCPASDCGPAGTGSDDRVSNLDLYIVRLEGEPEPPELPDAPVTGEVAHTVSCLEGNGRFDTNIVNPLESSARYRIEFQGLSPRENNVASGDWWRMPITGRADGDYTVVVRRDGAEISRRTIAIRCDSAVVQVSDEIQVVSACRAGSGYLLFQFVNPTASRRGWVIEFANVANRSTSAPAFGQSVRAVTGRFNGSHTAAVRADGVVIAEFAVTVDC